MEYETTQDTYLIEMHTVAPVWIFSIIIKRSEFASDLLNSLPLLMWKIKQFDIKSVVQKYDYYTWNCSVFESNWN